MTVLAIGNDEIARLPRLGKKVRCWVCGKQHPVEQGTTLGADGVRRPSSTLAFFRCGKQTYLCGINGKEWRPRHVKG